MCGTFCMVYCMSLLHVYVCVCVCAVCCVYLLSVFAVCVCITCGVFFFKLKTAADSHAHFPTEQSPAFFRHLQHLGRL